MQRWRQLLPDQAKTALRELCTLLLFSDLKSSIAYFRASHPALAKHLPPTLDLRIRQLNHHAITIRTRGTDARVVFNSFIHQFHLPPTGLFTSDDLFFLDLGANIGTTMAHMACLFPRARILGVEL